MYAIMRQASWQGYVLVLSVTWFFTLILGIGSLRATLPNWLWLLPALFLPLLTNKWRVWVGLIWLTALLAWCWQGWHWQQQGQHWLQQTHWQGQTTQVRYCVLDWPKATATNWQVRVRSPLGPLNLVGDADISVLRPGDCATGLLRLRPANEWQPPWQASSTWQQMGHNQAQADAVQAFTQLQPAPAWQRARHQLWQALTPLDNSGVVRALVLGSRSAMSSEQQQWLQQLGIFHLLVVSGLHLSLVVLLMLVIGRSLWLSIRWQVTLALLAACGYALLAGGAIPVTRALIMSIITLSAWYFRQPKQLVLLWFISVQVLSIVNPLVVVQPSFWLSCMALWWIFMALLSGGQWWRIQLAITLGLLPWQLLFGLYVNPLALLFNLLLTPIFALLLPLLLLGVALMWLSIWPLTWLVLAVQQLLAWLPLHELPLGQRGPNWQWWQLMVAQVACLALFAPCPLPAQRGAALLMAGLLLVHTGAPKPHTDPWLLLSHRQGLSLWWQAEQHDLWLLASPPSPRLEAWLWQWQQRQQRPAKLWLAQGADQWQPQHDWQAVLAAPHDCQRLPSEWRVDEHCFIWTPKWLWLAQSDRQQQYRWQQSGHARPQWLLAAQGEQAVSQEWQHYWHGDLVVSGQAANDAAQGLAINQFWRLTDSGQWQALFPWREPRSRLYGPQQRLNPSPY